MPANAQSVCCARKRRQDSEYASCVEIGWYARSNFVEVPATQLQQTLPGILCGDAVHGAIGICADRQKDHIGNAHSEAVARECDDGGLGDIRFGQHMPSFYARAGASQCWIAPAVMKTDRIVWYWIGSHAEYDRVSPFPDMCTG